MTQLVPVAFTPGMQLYKYQLINKIGEGSFGEVWLAREAALQRDFAIKILKPRYDVDHRLREARIPARDRPALHHAERLRGDHRPQSSVG